MSDLIELDRVEFRDPINAPGPEHDQYPTREKILVSFESPNHRLSSKQHYKLLLDEKRGVVMVKHPKAPTHLAWEYVPLTNVLAWRESPKAPEPAVRDADRGTTPSAKK